MPNCVEFIHEQKLNEIEYIDAKSISCHSPIKICNVSVKIFCPLQFQHPKLV